MAEAPIAIQTASLKQPFRDALATASRLGAMGVEIDARNELPTREFTDSAARQLRKMLEDLRLNVASCRFQTRRSYDVLEGLDARVDATKQAMRAAAAIRSPFVVNSLGGVLLDAADQQTPSENYDRLRQVLTDLGRFGHHVGVMLLAETGSESPRDLCKLLTDLPEGTLAVAYNPGALIVNGFDAREGLLLLRSEIRLVYANDAVRDLARGRGLNVQLGRGSVDWPDKLSLLEDAGYRGPFVIERQGADDPIKEIGQAVKYLRNI